MELSKEILQQYLVVVAVNRGYMNDEVAADLGNYDLRTFEWLLNEQINHLEAESKSDEAFFPPVHYTDGIESVSHVLRNLDVILNRDA